MKFFIVVCHRTWFSVFVCLMQFAPTGCGSVLKAMQFMSNPRESCAKMYAMMQRLHERINELKDDPKCAGNCHFHDSTVMHQAAVVCSSCHFHNSTVMHQASVVRSSCHFHNSTVMHQAAVVCVNKHSQKADCQCPCSGDKTVGCSVLFELIF